MSFRRKVVGCSTGTVLLAGTQQNIVVKFEATEQRWVTSSCITIGYIEAVVSNFQKVRGLEVSFTQLQQI